MGINREFVATLLDLRKGPLSEGLSVVELGAQDISCLPEQAGRMLGEAGFCGDPVVTASELYERVGFRRYQAIDTCGQPGVLEFDLNRDLGETYGFRDTFDLVTNLGTLEHCFDQAAAFRNMHRLCKVGGLMVHALPSAGNVNHGFYNYHPRFVADLAAANEYRILSMFIAPDYTPERVPYSLDAYRARDSKDLLLYPVLKRMSDSDFRAPTDGMYAAAGQEVVLESEFAPYIKTSWANITAE